MNDRDAQNEIELVKDGVVKVTRRGSEWLFNRDSVWTFPGEQGDTKGVWYTGGYPVSYGDAWAYLGEASVHQAMQMAGCQQSGRGWECG